MSASFFKARALNDWSDDDGKGNSKTGGKGSRSQGGGKTGGKKARRKEKVKIGPESGAPVAFGSGRRVPGRVRSPLTAFRPQAETGRYQMSSLNGETGGPCAPRFSAQDRV